jgi:L-threonylcarbamoyladenylate synthase
MTERAKIIYIEEDMDFAVNSAILAYRSGEIFIYPTDTIYGLGGDPFNKKTVEKILEVKGRQKEQKFIFLMKDLNLIKRYAVVNEKKKSDFLKKIWPSPVSVILELKKEMSDIFGSSTAAFRIPDNEFCLRLLTGINLPLISTSVNKSGQRPVNNKKIILKEFGNSVNSIFLAKQKSKNLASTIIDLTGKNPGLIREGFIKFDIILKHFYS